MIRAILKEEQEQEEEKVKEIKEGDRKMEKQRIWFLSFTMICFYFKQGRIHGYLSRVRVGRGGEKKAERDGQTDRQTDRASCRVACTRLKRAYTTRLKKKSRTLL